MSPMYRYNPISSPIAVGKLEKRNSTKNVEIKLKPSPYSSTNSSLNESCSSGSLNNSGVKVNDM